MRWLSLLILFALPLAAHAQLTTVQGGTGLKGILTGSIPFGSLTNIRMATSSGLQWDNTLSKLTFTNGSTTVFTVSGTSYLGTVASGIWNGTAIDISSFTNLTAGDALTLTGDDLDFDGGATPSGDLGGTWASPSVTNDSHAHTGATLSGIDISDDTNLAGDTEIVLTGDSLSIASTIARDSELHSAVTVTGEDYLSLATQQITANAIDPDNLSASDFGDFTCNGTTCSLDASYQPLDSDLTDLGGLTAAAGDLIYGNGTGDWAKRAATTNGFILALSGGIPTWVATTTFSSGLTYLNGNVTADLGTAITSSEITNDEIVNADINTAAAISVSKLALTAGDALTITGDDIDFDGGATPSGDLGGTWASPSVTDDSHAHTGGTISGLDISGDTNLTAGDGLTLTDDDLDCDTASGSVFGCLSAADWTTFNTKLDGSGSARALTVWNDAGTGLTATSSNPLYVGALVATTTTVSSFVGNVGIGATSPLGKLSVETEGASNDIFSAVYGEGFSAGLNFYSTNGTQASPTANSNGQPLGLIRFQGFDTARSSGALITATTSAEWGTAGDASDNPTDLQFFTAANGAAITAIPRMVITSAGNVGIATTTPPAALTVVPTSGGTAQQIFRNAASNVTLQITNLAGNWHQGVNNFGDYGFRFNNGAINGSNAFLIASTSAIGIATSTPAFTLDVFGSARIDPSGQLIVPVSSNPTLSNDGAIAVDTTSNQLKYRSGAATRVLAPGISNAFVYATSTMGTGSTTIKVSGYSQATTFTKLGCNLRGTGRFVVQMGDGTASTTAVASSNGLTTTFTTLASNNAFTAGEAILFQIGSATGVVADPSCSYERTIDAD